MRKNKKESMVREFMKGNRKIVDGKEIANSFNDFFTNIEPELAKKLMKFLEEVIVTSSKSVILIHFIWNQLLMMKL